MSVYGTTEPKIVNGSTTVNLNNSKIFDYEILDRVIENLSNINGNRYFYCRQYNLDIRIQVNIHKYAVPLTAYEEIMDQLHQDVTLYPFRDHDPVKDVNSVIVPFTFTNIKTMFLETTDHKDVMILTFKSTKPVDLLTTTLTTLITEAGIDIITEDGQGIIAG